MGETPSAPDLLVLQNVRCLQCAAVYGKPVTGGTLTTNPGCPDCGYVGWVAASVPVLRPRALLRSVEGRTPLRRARSR